MALSSWLLRVSFSLPALPFIVCINTGTQLQAVSHLVQRISAANGPTGDGTHSAQFTGRAECGASRQCALTTNPDKERSGGGADVHRISDADLTVPNLCGTHTSAECAAVLFALLGANARTVADHSEAGVRHLSSLALALDVHLSRVQLADGYRQRRYPGSPNRHLSMKAAALAHQQLSCSATNLLVAPVQTRPHLFPAVAQTGGSIVAQSP